MSDIYQQLGIVHWVARQQHEHTPEMVKLMVVTMPSADSNPQTEQLLTAMLKSIDLTREDVQVTDTGQITTPTRLILAMGELAVQALLNTKDPLESLRGKLHYCGENQTPLIATYHPAHLIQHPADKRKAYADLLFLKAQHEIKLPL